MASTNARKTRQLADNLLNECEKRWPDLNAAGHDIIQRMLNNKLSCLLEDKDEALSERLPLIEEDCLKLQRRFDDLSNSQMKISIFADGIKNVLKVDGGRTPQLVEIERISQKLAQDYHRQLNEKTRLILELMAFIKQKDDKRRDTNEAAIAASLILSMWQFDPLISATKARDLNSLLELLPR